MEMTDLLESRIGYTHLGKSFDGYYIEHHVGYWDGFLILMTDDSREEAATEMRTNFESSAAAFSAYRAKIEEMERDGFEIYYVEDPDDQPAEEGVSDWCEFKLIDESFDGTNRIYTLRYTVATKEELETWYEKRLSDDGYLKILKTVESYYSSGAFLLDFLAPEEFVEEDVIGTSFTIEDDPLEVLSQEPSDLPEKLIGRWIVTFDNSILTLTWNPPAWFPADDDWKMQDTQALFQRIDDAMQDQG